jgi:hypothetical protein
VQLDVTLQLVETPQGLSGWLEYDTDLFHTPSIDTPSIDPQINQLRNLLEGVARDPALRLRASRPRVETSSGWQTSRTSRPRQGSSEIPRLQAEMDFLSIRNLSSEEVVREARTSTATGTTARRRLGISQKELARRFRMDPKTIRQWEVGRVSRRTRRVEGLFAEFVRQVEATSPEEESG